MKGLGPSDLLVEVCSPRKLERDSAVEKLRSEVSSLEGAEQTSLIKTIIDSVLTKLESGESKSIESLQGCLAALGSAVTLSENESVTKEYYERILTCGLKYLKHDESRVRLRAAETLGGLGKIWKTEVYQRCEATILELISENISRKLPSSDSMLENKLIQKLVSSTRSENPDVEQIYHDTAGWHALESTLKCLSLLVQNSGPEFAPFLKPEMLDLVYQTLVHTNRFVRETGFSLLGSLIKNCEGDEKSVVRKEWVEIAEKLRMGLGDNWSQVRMAASVATRNFIMPFNGTLDEEKSRAILIPPMCINRYYLAEGVRLYSQQSWAEITKGDGIGLASRYVDDIVPYYISQSEADNHAVREAACHAVAELAVKIEKAQLQPHVENLIKALLTCFEDESWPVRDAACLATARFLSVFTDIPASKPEFSLEDKILPLFWTQLEDCIPSVRQGGAEGLASLASAYKNPVTDWLLPKLSAGLLQIKEQPADSEESQGPAFPGLSSGPAVFGVAKQIRANDIELHTGQEMYSCGSLAPKMKRGGGGGCSNHNFRRPSVPWEVSEGSLQLLAELSPISELAPQLSPLLPSVVQASRCRQFLHHVKYLETLCQRLPQIARNLGKRYFKPHLQEFLEPLHAALICGCQLTEVAAENCLREMGRIFGPSIIRGRIQMMESPHEFLKIYDSLNL